MAFPEERWAFKAFADGLKADERLLSDYEEAISSVVTEYNTSIFENRFIAGGAVELFTIWAMRSIGIDATKVGAQLRGADIQLPKGGRLSIKSSFTSPPGAIRLINVQGSTARAVWADPTIFLLAGVGLGYADPTILPNATKKTGDAIQITWPTLRKHFENHPELLVKIHVETKSKLTAQSKVASENIARDIVQSRNLQKLISGMK